MDAIYSQPAERSLTGLKPHTNSKIFEPPSDGHRRFVRGRIGGDDGHEVNYQFPDETSARAMVEQMMKASAGSWQDLTEALRRESAQRCDEGTVSGTELLQPKSLPGRLSAMTDEDRLQRMIEELRRMREQCEPKSNQNPRYLRYSNAVSALRWIIDDLAKERARG